MIALIIIYQKKNNIGYSTTKLGVSMVRIGPDWGKTRTNPLFTVPENWNQSNPFK